MIVKMTKLKDHRFSVIKANFLIICYTNLVIWSNCCVKGKIYANESTAAGFFFFHFFGINDWQCYKCVQFEVKSKRMFHAIMNSTKATKTKL